MALINACKFVAIPSRQDAMPLVALEAGVESKPILITNTSGFSEIDDFGGGVVVSASVEAIAHGLRFLLTSKQHLELMGARLNKHISANLLWSKIAQEHETIISQVLS